MYDKRRGEPSKPAWTRTSYICISHVVKFIQIAWQVLRHPHSAALKRAFSVGEIPFGRPFRIYASVGRVKFSQFEHVAIITRKVNKRRCAVSTRERHVPHSAGFQRYIFRLRGEILFNV